eukprot:gene2062-18835_t
MKNGMRVASLMGMFNQAKAAMGITVGRGRVLVGTDGFGNKYFETLDNIDKKADWHNGRELEPYNKDPMEYDPHSVPALWAQWLRGAVKHPPTPEQLQADMNRADILAYRVEKLEIAERATKDALLIEEQEVKGILSEHAAIKGFSAPAKSVEPKTAAGGVFVPGEWMPGMPMPETDEETEIEGVEGWSPVGGVDKEAAAAGDSMDDAMDDPEMKAAAIKAFYEQREKEKKGL